MENIGNYKVQLALIALISLIIYSVFQSIRIEQLKNINPQIIKAMGQYEEKSKIESNIKVDSIISN